MSVDKCTRTVGGVRIPHAVCVRHLRYVYTHAHFLRCLYTYGRSLTGTDEKRRSDAMATLGDGVCTLTSRPDGMPTRCDGLSAHRDGVCAQKCDNPRRSTCLYDILKANPHDFSHWVCTCWSVRLSACFTLACPIFYFNLNLCILGLDICLFYSFFISHCVTNLGLRCRIYFSYMKDILNFYLL